MVTAIYLLVIIAVTFIFLPIFGKTGIYSFRLRLPQTESIKPKKRLRYCLSLLFPFSRKLLEKLKLDTKIKNNIDASHVKITPEEFFSIKLLLMTSLIIGAFFLFGKFEPLVLLVGGVLGYLVPDFWLRTKISQRKNAIVRILPETVDLLSLCVEAGLDFATAAKWIVEKTTPNPMIEELAFVLDEIKWGKPHTQALKDMAKRLNTPEVNSFAQTLIHAERMGTPVVEAFAILSEDSRLQRFHQGERFALKAPIKILIPLIFCILPVVAIIIGGPILLQFTKGGLIKGF